LNRANELDGGNALTYWHLADAWYARSIDDTSALQRSLALWNHGAALQLPDSSTSWAYVLRALMNEQLASFDDSNRIPLLWEAVPFLERAILLYDDDASCWAYLGRIHRLLENESTALHATSQAHQRDPDNVVALGERAAILADTGAFDEARGLIEQRLATDPTNPWAKSVKAYILMHQKAYQAALEVIDEVIAAEPDSTWNLDVRATCCRMLGDTEGARAAYAQILDAGKAMLQVSSEDAHTCAFAAYKLGETEQAIAMLEETSPGRTMSGNTMRLLGLCHLAKGRVERAEELLLGGVARGNARELEEFLSTELPDVEGAAAICLTAPGATASFNRVKRTAAALLAELRRTAGGDVRSEAEAELTLLLQAGQAPSTDEWAEAGARASLGRLQLEGASWQAAATTYRSLRRTEGLFPEARIGIERAVEGLRVAARRHLEQQQFSDAARLLRGLLDIESESSDHEKLSWIHQEIGDALWKGGNAVEALEHFEKGLATVHSPEGAFQRADLHGRIALVRQQLGQIDSARASVVESIRLFGEARSESPGRALGGACRPLLWDVGHFWQVEALWSAFEEDPSFDVATKCEIPAARESLTAYLDDVYHLSKHTGTAEALPVVTPIALEVGTKVVPLVDPNDPKADGGKFIYEDIPAMRQRIEGSTGMQKMPGIRVREDPAGQEGYVIVLDGTPVATGAVRVGFHYCFASLATLREAGVSADGVDKAPDPLTGEPGFWCSSTHWDMLAARGVELLTETQFILGHVEGILRLHLDSFLGLEEANALIAELQTHQQHADFVAASLTDQQSRLLFARVLRALVREGVPLTDWAGIVEGVKAGEWLSVSDMVRETRLKLKAQLRGNQDGTTLIQVPAQWDELVQRESSDVLRVLASPEAAHRMIAAVRQWLQAQTGPVALVTGNTELRPVVRRLIEYEFPSIAVLSRDEVTRPEQIVRLEDSTVASVVSRELR
jgi:tetratricopeptide (TPR) repeat protein